ncbi:MAG: DUF1211 domain-containing protein [Terrimonas sp.]|nr:DUF1211 domain-containing protein [Terrimonas sp.]
METKTKETTRIEAFSDGVFAIAITLLVLELIATLHPQEGKGLLQSSWEHWESFLAFIIGFITILVCWINHHYAFEPIKKVDNSIMWINGSLLFLVTLTPFPTAILAEYLEKESHTALAIYGANYVLISVAAYSICRYAYTHQLIDHENRESYHSFSLIYRYAILYTMVAFCLCFVSILLPILMYIALFIAFAVPKKFAVALGRMKQRRKNTKKQATGSK